MCVSGLSVFFFAAAHCIQTGVRICEQDNHSGEGSNVTVCPLCYEVCKDAGIPIHFRAVHDQRWTDYVGDRRFRHCPVCNERMRPADNEPIGEFNEKSACSIECRAEAQEADINTERLRRVWRESDSLRECAEKIGHPYNTVRNALVRHGIKQEMLRSSPKEPVETVCANCGSDITKSYTNYNRARRNFCDRECRLVWERENARWRHERPALDREISGAIYRALHHGRVDQAIWDELPYSPDELREHIEQQFEDGMTWNNRGEWHLDHVVPKVMFNYTDVKDLDFQRAWSLENLQPLWAEENLKKNDRLDEPFQPALRLTMN